MKKAIILAQSKLGVGNMQLFSYGNSKLPTETLIVNITSARNCPSDKLGLCNCSNVCYAKKCERIYSNYLNKNLEVEKLMSIWTETELYSLLCSYIDASSTPIKYLRLNEAGDFRSQDDITMWNNISKLLHNKYNIKTYCYTCRNDLDFSKASFSVNGSRSDINCNRHFICVDNQTFLSLPKGTVTCKGNCRLCKLCYDSSYTGTIYCKQH